MLQAYLPPFKGWRVVLSVVPDTYQDIGLNWVNITTAVQQVDQLTSSQQRDIFAHLLLSKNIIRVPKWLWERENGIFRII